MPTPIASKNILAVIILTRDEEENLSFALETLSPIADEIFIVDSGSSDRTQEIATAAGCKFVIHEWKTYADQFNWALENLTITSMWTMRLDSDERLTSELVAELKDKLTQLPETVTGLMVKRRVYFWGRWIRHGGYYPIWLLRFWRTGLARCEARHMDEHMLLERGSIEYLAHDIIDENHKGLGFWIDKHNRYADREIKDILSGNSALRVEQFGAQIARKRRLKNNLYHAFPKFLRAFLYWFFRYFFLLGFLDGKPGFVFHFLQGFWYRLVVDAKLHELDQAKRTRTSAKNMESVRSDIKPS